MSEYFNHRFCKYYRLGVHNWQDAHPAPSFTRNNLRVLVQSRGLQPILDSFFSFSEMLPQCENKVHPHEMIEQLQQNKLGLDRVASCFKKVSGCPFHFLFLTCHQTVIIIKGLPVWELRGVNISSVVLLTTTNYIPMVTVDTENKYSPAW